MWEKGKSSHAIGSSVLVLLALRSARSYRRSMLINGMNAREIAALPVEERLHALEGISPEELLVDREFWLDRPAADESQE